MKSITLAISRKSKCDRRVVRLTRLWNDNDNDWLNTRWNTVIWDLGPGPGISLFFRLTKCFTFCCLSSPKFTNGNLQQRFRETPMTDHHAIKRGEATVLVAPSYRNWNEKLQPCCSLTGLHTLFVHLRGYIRNTVEMQLCSCLVIGFQISR